MKKKILWILRIVSVVGVLIEFFLYYVVKLNINNDSVYIIAFFGLLVLPIIYKGMYETK